MTSFNPFIFWDWVLIDDLVSVCSCNHFLGLIHLLVCSYWELGINEVLLRGIMALSFTKFACFRLFNLATICNRFVLLRFYLKNTLTVLNNNVVQTTSRNEVVLVVNILIVVPSTYWWIGIIKFFRLLLISFFN